MLKTTAMETLNKWVKNRKILIAATLVLLLVLFALVSLKRKSTQTETPAGEEPVEQPENLNADAQSRAQPPPVVTFEELTNDAPQQPQPPAELFAYRFKSNIPVSEVNDIADKLGFSNGKTQESTVIVYNLNDEINRGYLEFDLTNGSYVFRSYGTHASPADSSQTMNEKARMFLANMGVIDDTVQCPITYQKKDVTDVTFVECHRDWQKLGLPILSLVGLINVPETESLSNLQLGMLDSDSAQDPNVYNTSTDQDALKRPDDFNTATVALRNDDGSVVAINSNLRQLAGEPQPLVASQIYSVEEAWNKFASNQPLVSFIEPAGEGTTDWNTAFPNNTAPNLNGSVTDYVLAYVEGPAQQTVLQPMFIVRGKTTLESGFEARFIQAIPASTMLISQDFAAIGQVAGLQTNYIDDPTLKLRTFSPDQKTFTESTCVPAINQLSPVFDLSPFGMVGQFTLAPKGTQRLNTWYLIPAATNQLPEILAVTSAFDALNLPNVPKNEVRDLKRLQDEWAAVSICPMRLTGSSPSILIYGPVGSSLTIKVNANLTYEDPGTVAGVWNINIKENNVLFVNGVDKRGIYYEYEPVSFKTQNAGWVVNRGNLKNFIENDLSNLRLTAYEKERLYHELNNAAAKLGSDRVKIRPVSQQEVSAKLPLVVSPNTYNVQRYFYSVAPFKGSEKLSTPQLSPVNRTGKDVLEFGAVTVK